PEEDAAAAMCYTSGTTGQPKGVLYSHRALALHSFAFALPDAMHISHHDSILVVQPMFHANAWGVPFSAVLCGSKMVFPGQYLDADSLLELLERERITFTGGVPTVWLRVLEALHADPMRWSPGAGLRIICAGWAAPEAMLRRFDRMGVRMIHFWGMTEITPAGTVSHLKRHMSDWPEQQQYDTRLKQGVALPFVDVRV